MQCRGRKKDVHEPGDDDADQAHEQKRAELREVALRRVAVKAHRGEGAGSDEEHPRHTRPGEDQEHHCERQPHQPGVEPEHHLRGARLHPLNPEAHQHDEPERRQDHQPDQRRLRDRLVKAGKGGDIGHDAGQRQPRRHIVVNAKHVLPKAGIDADHGVRRPRRPAGLRT